MKGLLVKDFLLIFQRKQTLLMFLVISFVMGFSIGGSFIVGYLCLLSTTLAVGTISYDDADNGLLFLLTWPISRQDYVLSKYVLCGIVAAVSWVLAFGFLGVLNVVKGLPFHFGEELTAAAALIPVVLLLFCLMIPVQLKYGPEKGRLVVMLFGGGLVGLFLLLEKFVSAETAAQLLDSIPEMGYLAAGIIFCLCSLLISIQVSIRIMEHKKL